MRKRRPVYKATHLTHKSLPPRRRARSWDQTRTAGSQARALSSTTDRLSPAGRVDSHIPVEDGGYRNKPDWTTWACSGEVCTSLGLESGSSAFLLFQSPQSSYHKDPLTWGTNHLHLQLCLTSDLKTPSADQTLEWGLGSVWASLLGSGPG